MKGSSVDFYVGEFTRLAELLPGRKLPWLARVRQQAAARFAEQGFPTTRDENWKYTSVHAIERGRFSPAPLLTRRGLHADRVAPLALSDAHLLAFVDGRHRARWSYVGALPEGVVLTSLATALEQEPDRLEELLEEDDTEAFAALNTAFLVDGAYLRLPAGARVEAPIQLLYIAAIENLAIQPRNVVIAGAGSRACIVEHHVAFEGHSYFTNARTRIVAGPGAEIEHYMLQQESPKALHIASVAAELAADSRFISGSFALGGSLARVGIDVALRAEGAYCELDGLYVTDGRQHVDHHTRIEHLQPRGTSREHYCGVVGGASRAVFNGKVVVHPDAQQTDAFQSNRNLLLSEQAEVDAKPELEIYADDVKCGHGATVGQLDPDQVFYLRSRGMDETAARAMLTRAFAGDVIERVRPESLRQRLDQILEQRLAAVLRSH